MIRDFAIGLKGTLKSYLSPCLQCSLTMALLPHSSDIRAVAAVSLASVFEAYVDAVAPTGVASQTPFISRSELAGVMIMVVDKLLIGAGSDIHAESRNAAMGALRDVLEAIYESGAEAPDGSRTSFACSFGGDNTVPAAELLKTTVISILQCCKEGVERRAQRENEIRSDERLDDEDREGEHGQYSDFTCTCIIGNVDVCVCN